MKFLKTIGIVVISIIALLLIVALFVSNDFNYEKSITINTPIEKVWEHTNKLSAMDVWTPWLDYDPNMKIEITGTDGTIGAMSTWKSDNENVGSGSQTITKIEAPTLLATKLKFAEPFESEADGYLKLKEEGNNTLVTWGFKSKMPYPFNLMKLTMNMEEAVGKDFGLGLNKLKKLCENE